MSRRPDRVHVLTNTTHPPEAEHRRDNESSSEGEAMSSEQNIVDPEAHGSPIQQAVFEIDDPPNHDISRISRRQKVVAYLKNELRSITSIQWVIMLVLATVGMTWTYNSWRLAAWTAKLNYLQECRDTL